MFSSQGSQVSNDANYIEDVFRTYLFTGNSTTNTITNGIDLSTYGGLLWTKSRSSALTGALYDSAVGLNKYLIPSSTALANANTGVTFNTNGFTVGANDNANSTTSAASWTFRKQPKFFDVVTYTGTGSATTIAHNLGSVPGCIIVKRTDTTGAWQVYHRSLANTEYMVLNTTAAKATGATRWNSTTPTSTVFSVGTDATVNASGGTYVAYLFAHDAGGFGLAGTDNVISCGSMSASGQITLGWEPQWVMMKRTDSTSNWMIVDNMRGLPASGNPQELQANTTAAETNNGSININATGFYNNLGAATYIYIAIRRGPMKVPTDATKVYYNIARTGTGATANITSGFVPDLIIGSARGVANGSAFSDFLRGPKNILFPYGTYAESTLSDTVTARTNTTYTVSADASTGNFNTSGATVVHNVFSRAPSFFDEVCYTGTGSARTVAHNLGVVPEMMIVKSRAYSEAGGIAGWWIVYASGLSTPQSGAVFLNTTDGRNGTSVWNNTLPTSSVFTVDNNYVNYSGDTYVAYLFATCAGVSKVGNYTGNGSTQTINCGFAGGARFVLIKRTDSTGNWYVYDTARGMTTLTDPYLLLNSTAAESATLGSVTTVTGGFAVNASILSAINTNSASYVFLAIA